MATAATNAQTPNRAEEKPDDSGGSLRGCTTVLGLNLTIDARFSLDRKSRLRLRVVDPKAPGLKVLDIAPKLFRRTMGVQRAQKIFARLAEDRRDVHFFEKIVDAFDLAVETPPQALARVPREGKLLVVANHPLNGVDGMAIGYAVSRVRPDVKIMLTATFDGFPGMAEHGIFVCDGNGPSATSRAEPTRRAINWLREGHALILFPAAQGSYVREPGHKAPVDVPWLKGTSLFIRRAKADVLPVYVHGSPGRLFLALRHLFHPAAAALLVREIVNQRGSKVRLKIGEPVPYERLAKIDDSQAQIDFLRQTTYELAGGPAGAHAHE